MQGGQHAVSTETPGKLLCSQLLDCMVSKVLTEATVGAKCHRAQPVPALLQGMYRDHLCFCLSPAELHLRVPILAKEAPANPCMG